MEEGASLEDALEPDSRDILEVNNKRIPFLPGVSCAIIHAHNQHAVHRCKRWGAIEGIHRDRVHQ